MRYEVTLTVDNNRIGAYRKCFARKKFTVEASSREQAYTLACFELIKIPRYRNATIRPLKNTGSHVESSYSINHEYIKEISKRDIYMIFCQTDQGKECIDEADSLSEAKSMVKEYQIAFNNCDVWWVKMKEEV